MENQTQNTSLTLITGILTLLMQIAVSFLLSPFIVRTLGEAANGFTQLANDFATYASLITVAFNSMTGRFMSVSYHQNRLSDVDKYYSTTVVCNIIITCIFIPLAVYLIHNLDSIINIGNARLEDVKLLFTFVFLNFFGNLVLSTLGLAFFVRNKLFLQNIINLLRSVFNALLLLFLFSFFSPKMYYVSLSNLILTTVSIPIYYYFNNKTYASLRFSFSKFKVQALGEIFKAGIWNAVNQGGHLLTTGLDLLLANLFLGTSEMGLISISKTVPSAFIALASVINTSFLPKIILVWSENEKEKFLFELRKVMNISCLLLSIPIGIFSVFSKSFYLLWMPKLNATQLSVLSLLAVLPYVFLSGTQSLYNVFTAANKLKLNSISFLISGILNILIVYGLLLHTDLGMYAIVGTASIIYILRSIFFLIPYTAKIVGVKSFFFYKNVMVSIAAAVITVVISKIILHFIPVTNWFVLVLDICISCLFALFIVPFSVFAKSERQNVLNGIIQIFKRKKHENTY